MGSNTVQSNTEVAGGLPQAQLDPCTVRLTASRHVEVPSKGALTRDHQSATGIRSSVSAISIERLFFRAQFHLYSKALLLGGLPRRKINSKGVCRMAAEGCASRAESASVTMLTSAPSAGFEGSRVLSLRQVRELMQEQKVVEQFKLLQFGKVPTLAPHCLLSILQLLP